MTWQYRLVREPVQKGAALRMAEVHYAEGTDRGVQWPPVEAIRAWAWAGEPQGDTRQEVQGDLEHMMVAAKAPIIPAAKLPGYLP